MLNQSMESDLSVKRKQLEQLEKVGKEQKSRIEMLEESVKDLEGSIESADEARRKEEVAKKKKIANFEKIIVDMRDSYEQRLEAAHELANSKDDLYLQWKEKKDLAERDLKAAQLERNDWVERLKESKIEYEFELKRLRVSLKEQLNELQASQDKFVSKETKLLEQNKNLLQQVDKYIKENQQMEQKYDDERRRILKECQEKTGWFHDLLNMMHLHVACLGCDQLKLETMKLVCGHNICRICLTRYSATDHPKSCVRCEICKIETKVLLMNVSIPNRAICSLLNDAEAKLGRRLCSTM